MLERDIEKGVTIYSAMYDYISYKFTSPSNRSVPDRVFINPNGIVIFVEFKKFGKKLTTLQSYTFDKFKDQGCNIFMIDNLSDGKKLIEEYASKTS